MTLLGSKFHGRTALTRRRFGLLLSAAFSILSLGGASRIALSQNSDVAGRLGGLYCRSACVIGRKLLLKQAVAQDRDGLVEALLKRLQFDSSTVLSMDEAVLRRAIAISISDDFARGSTVSADGWFLSRTEAQLCALAELGRA